MSHSLHFSRTRLAVLWTSVLNEPLWTLYSLIAFILHKDLGATALQIGVLTTVRPLVSLLSLYWNRYFPGSLRSNVVTAGLLARVPFLFFPFLSNVWVIICAIAFYMMLSRGQTPAWVEIIKRNLPDEKRGTIFSIGSAFAYLENVFLAIAMGYCLDHYLGSWRWLFPAAACMGFFGLMLQARIPVEEKKRDEKREGPWKEAWHLLKQHSDFRKYQWGFMLCGFGIMVIQPALPAFFVDVLGLSYTNLAIALSIWRGIGFVASSPIWGKWFHLVSIYFSSSLVALFMGLFPLLLMLGPLGVIWVYLAYLAYGIAQGGSHLSWNLSGTIFAKDGDSSLYSSVNILMVGLRGAFVPPLGSMLCVAFGPIATLIVGVLACTLSSLKMIGWSKQQPKGVTT